jgi:hypothetical protein
VFFASKAGSLSKPLIQMWLFSVFIFISRWQTSVNCRSRWETLVVLRTVVGFYLFMNYVLLSQKSHVECFRCKESLTVRHPYSIGEGRGDFARQEAYQTLVWNEAWRIWNHVETSFLNPCRRCLMC